MTSSGAYRYEIRDASGLLFAYHHRQDLPDGGKKVWWTRPDGARGLGGVKASELPLYGINQLGDESTVVLVEGEKCRDALAANGVQAVASVTGAHSCSGKRALAELTGRRVILWPDADDIGRAHMRRVADGLAGIASEVRWFEPPADVPKGWDAADAVAAGWDRASIEARLAEAVPVPAAVDTDSVERRPTARRSTASRLVELAETTLIDLFHDHEQRAFAAVPKSGHAEIYPIRSAGFRQWLQGKWWSIAGTAANSQAVADALGVLEAIAVHDGLEEPVHVRLASRDGEVYLDLGDEAWRAVKVTRDGWRIIDQPPVRFRRPKGLGAFHEPTRGGSIDELRPFLNLGTDPSSDDRWRLLVGWLLMALSPKGPYPILAIHGEQGSAKTTLARMLRALVDPSESPVSSEPRELRDLMIGATNSWVLSLDNVSGLSPWLSDGLCRLSTGGGLRVRQLYSDQDEMILDAKRPVIVNGISDVGHRGDLLDRMILVELPVIDDGRRQTEADLWRAFDVAAPRILGALLDAISEALRTVDSVRLDRPPRMADFANWVVAAEPSLNWPAGAFLDSYRANRRDAQEVALDASPVVPALGRLLDRDAGGWRGTASELVRNLRAIDPDTVHARGFPSSPRAMAAALKRLAPDLRSIGIRVDYWREAGSGRRMIEISLGGRTSVTTVTSSHSKVDDVTVLKSDVTDPLLGSAPPSQGRADHIDGRDGCDDASADLSACVEVTYPASAWDLALPADATTAGQESARAFTQPLPTEPF